MDYQRLTHKIFQRLLRESQEEKEERGRRRLAQGKDLAAFRYTELGMKCIVLYETAPVLRGGPSLSYLRDATKTMTDAMRGVIEIAPTEHPCNGAWEVKASAVKNKGDGGLIYGLAFAASPNGILTPDRTVVSTRAQAGWAKQSTRDGAPFDDAKKPRDQRKTPDDPSDDCILHRNGNLEALNRSYKEEGWEKQLLASLRTAHNETMFQIGPDAAKAVKQAMVNEFGSFFDKHMHEEA